MNLDGFNPLGLHLPPSPLSLNMFACKIKIHGQEQDEDLVSLSCLFCVHVLLCIYVFQSYYHLCGSSTRPACLGHKSKKG